jgi:replicative DNA helicase
LVQALEPVLSRRGGGRVPPHNLEAEESLLGAMLLSRDAISAATEAHVEATDFYKPAHGHIYEAIMALYGQGEPVDLVTVADELDNAELLESLGGRQALLRLQAATPASANAGHYAKIVNEDALLRRLISVAGDIAEMGYDESEDVAETLDRAESLVFEVAERRVSESMVGVSAALQDTLDQLEALYGSEGDITGVETGYTDLDHLLLGLQPSNLIVVAARPGMGKALSLDTPLPTPEGWTLMRDIRVGDRVLDDAGQPCNVTDVTPGLTGRPCFEITLDDRSTLTADAEHLWLAYDNAAWRALRERGLQRPRVVTTRQMIEEGLRLADRPNWYLPLVALDLPETDLPVDPYVLGCWLGDGTSSTEKQIPAKYLRASFKQRLALLQGLMDTDGCVTNRNGTVELCLMDRALLAQAHELVCSLGHKAGPIRRKPIRLPKSRTAVAWRFCWSPLDDVFRLSRKSAALADTVGRRRNGRATRRAIVSIRPVPTTPVRCIAVDSPKRVYLAGRTMIPTHNSSFGLGAAANVAMTARRPVMFFSMEMGTLELTKRLLAAEARVDARRLQTGNIPEADWGRLSHAVGRLAEVPLYIDDNPHCTVMEMRAKARRAKARHGDLGLIVVDYIQLMTPSTTRRLENRQVEVAEISRGLKILARELDCPVMGLSQLNRQLEYRQDKRPMLADLRESGGLEQDSDVVIFIYRDELYNMESDQRGTAEIIVAKHRNGPTGITRLAFLDHFTKFANMARE